MICRGIAFQTQRLFLCCPKDFRFVFGILSFLAVVSCQAEDKKTPAFSGEILQGETSQTTLRKPSVKSELPKELDSAKPPESVATRVSSSAKKSSAQTVVFMSYNLRNYLTMERYHHNLGQRVKSFKPEKETEALHSVIVANKPDLLGICEIGTRVDLENLRKALKSRGLNLPHTTYIEGSDTERHLAFLSRFPIRKVTKPRQLTYRLKGRRKPIRRGILDVTIQIGETDLRLLGVHLKSKRPAKNADQAEIRRSEAHLLRKHLDVILENDSKENLVVYGDFNDDPTSATIRATIGNSKGLKLHPIPITDDRGYRWTHWWKRHDIYSRFDYIFTSESLSSHIDKSGTFIIDSPDVRLASDHRPLVLKVSLLQDEKAAN